MYTLRLQYINKEGKYQIGKYRHIESLQVATDIINSFEPEQIIKINLDFEKEGELDQ